MLSTILSELNGASKAIMASSVLSTDGMALASLLPESPPPGLSEDNFVALSSALMALGRKAAMDLAADSLERVHVAGKAGSVLITQAGPEAILSVVFSPDAETGMIASHMQRAANDIKALVAGDRL
jgi:predicted regulator of Ras-like GTPase activity (Roadblock/LC7/MglB family)